MDLPDTPWSEAMRLEVPVVSAPMGGVAGGALAAAVSRAGGLGMIGMGSSATTSMLREQLGHVGGLDRPFGIGLIGWRVRDEPALLTTALEARPALLSVSFGDDVTWIGRAHDAGCETATQVADLEGALRAVDAGVDVLVARGAEGGGHGRPRVATLTLLAQILDRVEVPVLSAGGIGSARALAAVLAAGAAGAWLGTAFAACRESLLPDGARQAMIAAHATDTVTTRAFDVAFGYPWPAHTPERLLRNAFTDRWDGREEEIDGAAVDALHTAIARQDYRVAPVNAGQGVGEVTAVESVATVIARLAGVIHPADSR
ncbi:2-nitropropane dioxygenase [Mycolicibacterium chubuense]|jgi:nitronate monooxygenase|uniref:Nitronate monooxygenase n=1 Tax=Mycolicibacterium chubuense TaxID=1800 RepID=A0A0J6WL75_MYCCU|nr:nitronate monooxygenase [Mycolicibacterium chubuense]KMO84080.1 Nitronate monooxygenase [Mycolicibacterium chubuense]ORA51960.1 2-nitropropane dioxygenase [Mycolicibacterium chubuense]SPX99896.1 2-nitropropane dioxygenase-like enzyme [Mycolicibacterium chubuense]